MAIASNPSWALQKSIVSTLSSSPDLQSVLGSQGIYDDTPQNASFPYLTLGQSTSLDWSTSTEDGQEHLVTLHVWSRGNGKKEAYSIINLVRDILNKTDLELEDHYLVNLVHEFSEARMDQANRAFHGVVRFRAVTEPQN